MSINSTATAPAAPKAGDNAKIDAAANTRAIARLNAVVGSEHYAGNEKLATAMLGHAFLSADDILSALAASPIAVGKRTAKAKAAAVWDKANAKLGRVKPTGRGSAGSIVASAASSVWDRARAKIDANRGVA